MEQPNQPCAEQAAPAAEKYCTSIDLLNRALGMEISTSLQYMYFHVRFEDAGYAYLARTLHRIAIAEMRHCEELAERILFLEGDVEMNPVFRSRQMSDVKQMLQLALEIEQSTVDHYNEWSRICSEQGDAVSHKMFQDLLVEEEEHLDIFRTELQNLREYGDSYLLLQSAAWSKANGKKSGRDED